MHRFGVTQSLTPVFMASMSAILVMMFAHSASAVLVYHNSAGFDNARAFTSQQQGDEINLAGTERTVVELHIGVSMQHRSGTADLQAWMYANDGPEGKPGTMLWASELMETVPLTGGEDFIQFDVPNVTVPDTFTWTLQISNTTPTAAGLPLCNPPSIGSSALHSWFGSPGSWTRIAGSTEFPGNYMAKVVAVPEPGSILLLSFGGIAFRLRRRRA